MDLDLHLRSEHEVVTFASTETGHLEQRGPETAGDDNQLGVECRRGIAHARVHCHPVAIDVDVRHLGTEVVRSATVHGHPRDGLYVRLPVDNERLVVRGNNRVLLARG